MVIGCLILENPLFEVGGTGVVAHVVLVAFAAVPRVDLQRSVFSSPLAL